ncbi:hypothetical protein M9H77_20965 [Catharanthus roseus]|uniref:Uncharacterized protein n=1 Tax=Catharanthus roseus TaxID=4058 RepID=A0ACC0AMG4_CATRO|nr:hypothetical protein M9H77_20965 [Catharanthus roseus]
MGRGKLNMELIRKEKSRNTTFKKRKEGLLRKIHEFTTLCDVSACMIIYGPKQEAIAGVEPEVWPENHEQVRQLIEIYRSKCKDSGSCRVYGLGDFFSDRKRRMEDELEKLRKKNMESKFPTWIDFLNLFSEMQLRSLAGGLSHKIEVVKNRIELIKGNTEQQNQYFSEGSHEQDLTMISKPNPNFNPGFIQRGLELDFMNPQQQQQAISGVNPTEIHVPIHYPTMDQEQYQMHSINQNSMMMLLMNENDNHHNQLQFGGANGCNVQRSAFKRQVFFESTATGVVDNMVYNNPIYTNPRPLTRYYAPTAVQPPHVRCPVRSNAHPLPPPLPPQLYHSRENNFEGNEIGQYRMDQRTRQ